MSGGNGTACLGVSWTCHTNRLLPPSTRHTKKKCRMHQLYGPRVFAPTDRNSIATGASASMATTIHAKCRSAAPCLTAIKTAYRYTNNRPTLITSAAASNSFRFFFAVASRK